MNTLCTALASFTRASVRCNGLSAAAHHRKTTDELGSRTTRRPSFDETTAKSVNCAPCTRRHSSAATFETLRHSVLCCTTELLLGALQQGLRAATPAPVSLLAALARAAAATPPKLLRPAVPRLLPWLLEALRRLQVRPSPISDLWQVQHRPPETNTQCCTCWRPWPLQALRRLQVHLQEWHHVTTGCKLGTVAGACERLI